MRKHTFKKKLLSVLLSILTIFSAGTAALTTAYNLPETVVYAADSLTPQESKLLKAEEKMIMGMAKTVFKDIPFFGNLVDGFDSILDLTGAFGSGSGGESISKEDLKELREHLDTELEKINQQIISMGDQLLNELGNEMYTMKIGDVIDDMYGTAVRDAERINTHLSDDSLTENEKLVEIAALIGRSNTWSSSEHKISKFWKVANLISGETVTKIDSKNLYDTIYEYFSKKVLFSGEAYDKATPYIDKIVYEFLYSQSVLVQCLGASLKVANFTDEEIAALSPTQRDILSKSTVKSIEDEIGAETMMLFNFHDQKSFISLYSNYLYNAENSRFTYLNKGKTMMAVNPTLDSYEPGSESAVGEIKEVKTNGSTNTKAHNAYKNEKTRLENALSRYGTISCSNISEMGSYVSSNYSKTGSVWDFLKDRGFKYTAPDGKTNLLVTNSKVRDDDPFSADGSGYNTYEHRYYLGYSGYVYNNRNLSPKDITVYALVDKKERDEWAYQSIAFNHFYRTYIASPADAKPVNLFYFMEADEFKNDSIFNFDSKTNTLTVTAKAVGAVGRQSVRVQYRENNDDNWTTSYAPTTVIALKDGCTYEVRTIISDEAGHKETTETQYYSAAKLVEEKRPYIDGNGDYKLGTVRHFEYNGKNYAVNEDGSMGKELNNVSLSDFEFASLGNNYQINYYIGSYDNIPDSGLVIPKTYQGKAISVIGSGTQNKTFMDKATGDKKQFVIILNENITGISDYAFYAVWVTKVTGNTPNLNKIGKYAFSWANNPGGNTIDIKLDNRSIYLELLPFNNMKVTFRIRHSTNFSRNEIGSKSKTYIFTDDHQYTKPVWQWSDDHSSATATFTCWDSKCRHGETLEATVTNIGNHGISYKATVEFNGKTYTDTYSVPHTHSFGEPVWTWSDDHSSAKATFTCSVCEHQETVEATVSKTENSAGLTYTANAVFSGREYSDTYKHTHTYGEPVWTWAKDYKTAKATFTCTDCERHEAVDATVTKTENDGKTVYTAAVEFNGQTYTAAKVFLYVPRTEPYVDSTGAYILGTVEHIVFEGKNYSKNADGSIGDELSNITFSYFDFALLDDDTFCIIRYKGTYEALANDKLIIPKTYNGKKITVLGNGRDNFIYAEGRIKYVYLVLNENITKIESVAFRGAMLRRVQGNTSGLSVIDSKAFSGAKTFDGYLSINLDYPGEVQVASDTFSQITRVIFDLKHETKLSLNNSGEGRREYYFTDAHIYGEPVWTWSDDHSKANVSLICTDERCQHKETRSANIVKTEENNMIVYTATAWVDGETYTDTYTEEKPHIHTYGEPTWTWSDDHSSAAAVFSCIGCEYQETIEAVITKTEEINRIIYTAAVEFGGKTYTDTYTEEKEETYVYYPAAKPYIDNEGAYILGYKEHYRYKGKYYAVNSDKSVGDEITDIWISYFKFALLPDDTYAIEYYIGATKDLTEIVIPKTFNGKKITTLGTDNLDVFIKAGKPQFELVLNENITEIKSCAFNKIGVTKVTGDTSGLCKIGEYAFSWVNKAGGYALDITFAYPGTITTGDAIFNHVNAVLHLGHGTTFSNMDFRATSITYDFTDTHIYGDPTWTWDDDYRYLTETLTCIHPGCGNRETVQSELIDIDRSDRDSDIKTKSGDYNVELIGYYSGRLVDAEDVLEGVNKLTVIFKDKNGNKVTPPQYIWTIKEIASGVNGGVDLTEGSKFFVQLRSPDGETIYSPWILVDLLGGGSDLMNVSSPDKEKTVPHTNGETNNSPRIPVESHSGSGQTNVSSSNEAVPSPGMPKTGDTASAAAVSAILLTSLITALFLAMKRKKDEEA